MKVLMGFEEFKFLGVEGFSVLFSIVCFLVVEMFVFLMFRVGS